MNTRKFVRLSILMSLAIVLSIFESIIPIFNGFIPGLKLGLANIIILIVIYVYSFKEALYVTILRVLLVSMLRTGLFSPAFFLSLSGALLSVISMAIFKKFTKLSVIGISIIGSITHSFGQILMATIILSNTKVMYYFPWLIIFSVITGIVTGIISKDVIKHFKKIS